MNTMSHLKEGRSRRINAGRFFIAIAMGLCVAFSAATADAQETTPPLSVSALRCEQLEDPLGIDVPQPRLSWNLNSIQRGTVQSAYQVLVASSKDALLQDKADVWDSGKVKSDQSIHVVYGGAALASHAECWWKVRVWNEDDTPSNWSEPARWTMGILTPEEWKAQWIGLDSTGLEGEKKDEVMKTAKWIWFPEGNPAQSAPAEKRFFRRVIELPKGAAVTRALCNMAADNQSTLFVNGKKVASSGMSIEEKKLDELKEGANVIALEVKNEGDGPNPAGLLVELRVEFASGDPLIVSTDASWKSTNKVDGDAWLSAQFDDAGWQPALELGPLGTEPWGGIKKEETLVVPARMLRKEFTVDAPVKRAMAYISGLGSSELYVNGQKVSDDVLSPALTEYNKRAFYVTYDVTGMMQSGANAVGVMLGNGRFLAPRPGRTFGFPKLLFHLRVEYADGKVTEVVSDPSWKLTTNGPIRANNEYDGETYDARMEMEGWAQPGFDDSAWQAANPVDAPGGAISAQMMKPIRITQVLHPIGMRNPRPGMYVFDMGQNMVGWCRLKVEGPRGASVKLRFAETVQDDGTLYLANIRGAKVTDLYTLKGGGVEVYEPRFTYHGFRFVEVTGFPGEPTLDTIEGCVVHDDVTPTGSFACSNKVINNVYRNIVWGVRGNYRSIPTDCPQRDERQGWLGDRSEETYGESYLHDTSSFHAKWVCDMHDAQKDNGSVSDVCPAYWELYGDDVTWPSSFIIIPNALLLQYGDRRVIERHYDGFKKWIDHMSGYLENDIISKDNYGDWCVPPEEQSLIHSKDPLRQTPKDLLATSYFYYDLTLMAKYADILGKADDKAAFLALAERLKTAFNAKFLDREKAVYGNGSQTSQVMPLAFGLVPAEYKERVFNYLVDKIMVEGKGHIGTGLIGGQQLMRVLSDNGRPDVAYTMATQTDYPSWGYMIEKGATTIWELWNGDTADPAMNSHNHVMLVGDLGIWMYQYLAGIRPDPQTPAYKKIVLRPTPVPGLEFARASHRSPHGMICSDWRIAGDNFIWSCTVPANTTATVYVPAKDVKNVTESGKDAKDAQGVKFVKMEGNAAVFEVGSGQYTFESKEFAK